MPQPRSTSCRRAAARSRAARWSATASRVACSSPSGVKYIRARQVAELRHAPGARSCAWVSGRGDLLGVAARAA